MLKCLSFPSGEHSEGFDVTYVNCPFQSGLPLCVNCLSGLVPLLLPLTVWKERVRHWSLSAGVFDLGYLWWGC